MLTAQIISVQFEHLRHLLIRPILPRSHVHKVEKRMATRKATHEILNHRRRSYQASSIARVCESLDIGIHTRHDPHLRRHIGDHFAGVARRACSKNFCSLATALLAFGKKVLVEDHAIAIDEDEDEWVTRSRALEIGMSHEEVLVVLLVEGVRRDRVRVLLLETVYFLEESGVFAGYIGIAVDHLLSEDRQ